MLYRVMGNCHVKIPNPCYSLEHLLCRNVAFFAGALVSVLLGLSLYDQDVLKVSNVITIIAVLGLIIKTCSSFIPDEVRLGRFFSNKCLL